MRELQPRRSQAPTHCSYGASDMAVAEEAAADAEAAPATGAPTEAV